MLYDDAVAIQSELQEALAAAMNRLQEAMRDFHKTQDRLGEADFQLGRTRYILRKSGYGEILGKKHGAGSLKVHGMIHIEPIYYCLQFQGGTGTLLSSSIE
jgi:hypothetical protein